MPTHTTPHPAFPRRLLRWLRSIVLSALLILGALWAAMYGWVVPRLDQWRPNVVQYLQDKTGLEITISTLSASRSPNWLPALQVEGITITAPQAPWQVEIPRMQVALSWPLLLGQQVGSLILEQPQVRLTGPLQAGRHNATLAADANAATNTPQANALQWLLAQPSIRVEGGSLSWQPATPPAPADSASTERQEPWSASAINLQLRHSALRNLHTLDIRFSAAQLLTAPVQLHLQGQDWGRLVQDGWPAWRQATGQWKTHIEGLNLQPFSALMAQWADGSSEPMPTAQGTISLLSQGSILSGEIEQSVWQLHASDLDWPLRPSARLRVDSSDLSFQLKSQKASPSDSSTQTSAQAFAWQAQVDPILLAADQQQWQSQPLTFSLNTTLDTTPVNANDRISAQITAAELATKQLDLGPLSAVLQTALPNTTSPSLGPHEDSATNAPVAATWERSLAQAQQLLRQWSPAGQLQDLSLRWQPAPLNATPAQSPWHIATSFNGLRVGRVGASTTSAVGIENLNGTLQAGPEGGKAELDMQDGLIDLPAIFDAGAIAVARLKTQLDWTTSQDGGLQVRVHAPEVANADAEGSATVLWRTSTTQEAQALSEQTGQTVGTLPGFLDLQAQLTRADARAVWRYLPHSVPADVRRYVQEAIQNGSSNNVQFEVRGNLKHFPFDSRQRDPITKLYPAAPDAKGKKTNTVQAAAASQTSPAAELFRISADLENVDFRYAPHYLLGPGQPALVWPDLQKVKGQLVFEGNRMDLTVQSGQLQAAPKVRISQGQAWIEDLMHASVGVDVQAAGPLADQLRVLASTPVARMTDHLMDPLQGDGNTAFSLQLGIPLEKKKAHHYSVKGQVQLQGNNLQWWPQVPRLSDARGTVTFTDKGFAAKRIQAQALGGPLTLHTAMQDHVQGQPTQVRIDAQGTLSAQGLQDYAHTALASTTADQLLEALHGQTDYSLRIDTIGARPYVSFSSALQGLGSNLPYPLDKEADIARPLTLSHATPDTNGVEQLELQLTDRVYARYKLQATPGQAQNAVVSVQPSDRPDTPTPASTTTAPSVDVLSGQLLIGQFSDAERRLPNFIPNTFPTAPVPPKVRATIAQKHWDVAAWAPWLMRDREAPDNSPKDTASPEGSAWLLQLIPNVWYGRFDQLQWGGLTLHDVQLQSYQSESDNTIWTSRFKAAETQGTLEYHPNYLDGTGLLRGKIDYLELPAQLSQTATNTPTEATSADDASGDPSLANLQHLPTVDVEIDRLLFAHRDWGKVALQAMNRVVNGQPSEWKINYLTMETPEARLTAKGSWQEASPHGGFNYLLSGRKKMDMQFTLEMLDAGRLLSRMGIPDVLDAGAGQLDGRLSWLGSPLKLDIPSLHGDFHLDVGKGQFLKANAGAGRLLGVLSLQALPRRLTLDFRDIFSEGFAFDFVRGDVHLDAGKASTNNLQMKGVNAGVVLEGSADIVKETQDITVVVVPELDAMTASLVATAINPAIGAGTFLAQFFFSKPLAEAATQEFRMHGSWSEPIVERQTPQKAPEKSSKAMPTFDDRS
ncbi:YhdP family protein [Lampropedia puyangensis]|nr:AsmA-like C-terminal region-containing protein [Lampropedia puyangensis]